jgi:hypothetical protein
MSKKIAVLSAAGVICYFLVWTVSFLLTVGPDSGLYVEYLKLAWTGRAGPIPASLQALSLVVSGALMLLLSLLMFLDRRHT